MKKQFLLLMLLFASLASVNAQEQSIDQKVDSNHLYQVAEEMPQFLGGQKELVKFLSSNVQYPAEACRAKIQGRAIVSFVVEPDGSVTNVGIAKGVAKILDDEAIRVVSMSPKWKPGKIGGKPVRVKYNLPITFKLDDEESVHEHVEQMPEFPGGQKALLKFLENNVRYPAVALANKIQGRTIVSFVVEPDGSVDNVEVAKSSSSVLDEEAVRVVKKFPKWKPGMIDGKPVRVKYCVPVNFKLQEVKEERNNIFWGRER